MSTAPVTLTLRGNATQAIRSIRAMREGWSRAMIPGYRWRDPHTGRFVRNERKATDAAAKEAARA